LSGKHEIRADVFRTAYRRTLGVLQPRHRRIVVGVLAAALVAGVCAGLLFDKSPLGPPLLVLPAVSLGDSGPTPTGPAPATSVVSAALPSPSHTPTHTSSTGPSASRTESTSAATPGPARPAPGAPPAANPAPFTARYEVSSSWDTGFIVGVAVTNTGTTVQPWTIDVAHAPAAGVRVVSNRNADISRNGATTRFSGGPVAPGETRTFGFEAVKSVPARVRPATCTINGAPCDVTP
jgi:hypothetical protein